MLTQERLKELLYYDQETGIFTRLISTSNAVKVGDIAGWMKNNGYICISVDNCKYHAHRLACLYVKGYWPEQMDHLDHVRDNNKWGNLREVSGNENYRNISLGKRNTSGVMGVYKNKLNNKWVAQIKIDGKQIYIGTFEDKFEAVCARKSAEVKFKFHENHGRK